LERAHHLMPEDGTVAEHLGDAYSQQKRYREALGMYRRALSMDNVNPSELRKKINQLEILLKESAN
jgi:hypothetical protein